MNNTKYTILYHDINYAIVYWCDNDSPYCMYFTIHELIGDEQHTPYYRQGTEYITDIFEAEVVIHGSVKWDHCSNWNFTDQYIHGCTRDDLLNIGVVLSRCWDIASAYLTTFDRA